MDNYLVIWLRHVAMELDFDFFDTKADLLQAISEEDEDEGDYNVLEIYYGKRITNQIVKDFKKMQANKEDIKT